MAKIEITLASFIKYATTETGESKLKCVRSIKEQLSKDYFPGGDFWKELRESIVKYHKKEISEDALRMLPQGVTERKRIGYEQAISFYLKFIKNRHCEYFDVGKSFWLLENKLLVKTTPTLGLKIDGQNYLVRIDARKDSDRKDKRKSYSSLAMMRLSESDYVVPENSKFAILNPVRETFYVEPPLTEDLKNSLLVDATSFVMTWDFV